ncbi:hypothetical protein A0H81_00625 [Grifola frondosa]|uniref:Uncharacterized protein n=1 Tax=Grifola frondosa TaxID=5627 RepID=A0A1C7MQ37_GRIFR|nr:hypothetical protein A0H81_00625 [Grifola frondosa]
MDDDEDYQPPGQKRQSRRYPPRTRQQHRAHSAATESTEVDVTMDDPPAPPSAPPEPSDEDMRLASSDLEDCEELWYQDLGTYVIETHKRQKQVDAWFSRWIIERDSITAYRMSHYYRDRLARIPPPPPLPPPRPTVEEELMAKLRAPSPLQHADDYDVVHNGFHPEDNGGQLHGIVGGAEGARELEDSLLGTSRHKGKGKGKGKDVGKRPASRAISPSSSELDVPIISARSGPPHKKRKTNKAADIADDLERSVVEDPASGLAVPSPAHKLVTIAKGKGRGKREQSLDSISVTTKTRKKPGPRKKLDTLPPQTQELLGVGSAAPSVSGDMTPSGSRPASPALTAVSATVYELDEAIPH